MVGQAQLCSGWCVRLGRAQELPSARCRGISARKTRGWGWTQARALLHRLCTGSAAQAVHALAAHAQAEHAQAEHAQVEHAHVEHAHVEHAQAEHAQAEHAQAVLRRQCMH